MPGKTDCRRHEAVVIGAASHAGRGSSGLRERELLFGEPLDLDPELVQILEAAVNGREAHEGDMVHRFQLPHDLFTHDTRDHLALPRSLQDPFYLDQHGLDLLAADGALLEGPKDSLPQFVFIEGFANPALLDDARQEEFGTFVGREALTATQALASPPDLVTLGNEAGVDHLGIGG